MVEHRGNSKVAWSFVCKAPAYTRSDEGYTSPQIHEHDREADLGFLFLQDATQMGRSAKWSKSEEMTDSLNAQTRSMTEYLMACHREQWPPDRP